MDFSKKGRRQVDPPSRVCVRECNMTWGGSVSLFARAGRDKKCGQRQVWVAEPKKRWGLDGGWSGKSVQQKKEGRTTIAVCAPHHES